MFHKVAKLKNLKEPMKKLNTEKFVKIHSNASRAFHGLINTPAMINKNPVNLELYDNEAGIKEIYCCSKLSPWQQTQETWPT